MPGFQTGSNALIAYKKQAGLGVPANGAGASVLRIAGGAGVKLAKQAIASNEIRSDGLSTRGRHGTQQVTAAYNAEASLGAFDPIIEVIMRGVWDANVLAKTQADFTSLTTVNARRRSGFSIEPIAVSAFALWAGPALFGAGTFGAGDDGRDRHRRFAADFCARRAEAGCDQRAGCDAGPDVYGRGARQPCAPRPAAAGLVRPAEALPGFRGDALGRVRRQRSVFERAAVGQHGERFL
jgi:Phage tail tube protein